MNEREKIKDLDRLWKLMANKLAGEANEEEWKELLALQAIYPDTTYGLQILEDLWKPGQRVVNKDHSEQFTRHLFRMAEKNAEKARHLSAQLTAQQSALQSLQKAASPHPQEPDTK
ncbi:hypothetical protein ACX0G9_05405 [Flavitalea flava]